MPPVTERKMYGTHQRGLRQRSQVALTNSAKTGRENLRIITVHSGGNINSIKLSLSEFESLAILLRRG